MQCNVPNQLSLTGQAKGFSSVLIGERIDRSTVLDRHVVCGVFDSISRRLSRAIQTILQFSVIWIEAPNWGFQGHFS